MPQVGPLELAVVLAVALIVFGPQKLPDLARTIGKTLGELRRMAAEVRDEFEYGLDQVEDEDREEPAPAVERPRDPDAQER